MSDKYGTNSKGQVKSYTGSLITFLVLLFIANQGATQYVAKVFNYHQNLGEPIYGHIYWFWMWLVWSVEYFNTYGYIFKTVYISMAAILLVLLIVFVLLRLLMMRTAKKHHDVHGTARWAEKKDIDEMGLIGQKSGVYVGSWKDDKGKIHYLRSNGPEHVLAFAPTGSGKGIGLVLPTLLSWLESAVILDIKGENWALTAGWRSKYANNRVLKFDPSCTDGTSVRINPVEEVRINTDYEVGDVQNLAMMIIDTDGKGLSDYWSKAGFTFLTGLLLHLIYREYNKNNGIPANLPKLYRALNDPDLDINAVIEEMSTYKHKQDENGNWITHPTILSISREATNKVATELSGVIGTVASNLGLYMDPLIEKNISQSDFKIKDLMNADNPISLYIVIKPTDKDRLKPLVRLIMNQILRLLTEEIKFDNGEVVKHYKHRLLLMLDEFASLGKLEIFQESLAFMRGYGIKSYIILQDTSQLHATYGKDEAIMANCQIKSAYASPRVETAEMLSKMTGTTTVVKAYTTTSGHRTSVVLGNVTESYQEVARPLLTPDECMTLPGAKKDKDGKVTEGGDMLIFVSGFPAIYGKQILFFKDKVFLDRSKVPAPTKDESFEKRDTFKLKIEV